MPCSRSSSLRIFCMTATSVDVVAVVVAAAAAATEVGAASSAPSRGLVSICLIILKFSASLFFPLNLPATCHKSSASVIASGPLERSSIGFYIAFFLPDLRSRSARQLSNSPELMIRLRKMN